MEEAAVMEKKKGLSGTALKIIALIAMFIDHFAAIFIGDYLESAIPPDLSQEEYTQLFQANPSLAGINLLLVVMRLIGRFGFPLFAFLMVEGFEHTRSVRKYLLNMLVFALISELPFNLGFSSALIYPGYQNVFFTLFLGLLCITFVRFFTETSKSNSRLTPLFYVSAFLAGPAAVYFLLNVSWVGKFVYSLIFKKLMNMPMLFIILGASGLVTLLLFMLIGSKWETAKKNAFTGVILPIFVFGLIAELLMTDYAAGGVLTIALMYLLRKRRKLAFGMGCLVLALMDPSELMAYFMLIPISMYNGSRGMKINKYVFYAFYPVHIGLIYLLTLIMGFTTFAIK